LKEKKSKGDSVYSDKPVFAAKNIAIKALRIRKKISDIGITSFPPSTPLTS
jgi:hypothetical protein